MAVQGDSSFNLLLETLAQVSSFPRVPRTGLEITNNKTYPFHRFTFIRSDMTPARAIQQSPSSFLEDSSTSSMEADPERDQRRYLNRLSCYAWFPYHRHDRCDRRKTCSAIAAIAIAAIGEILISISAIVAIAAVRVSQTAFASAHMQIYINR